MSWTQLVIELGRDGLARTEDACTRLGAIALSLADAGDEPLLEPAPGATPLWHEIRLRALFSETPEPALLAATLEAVLRLPATAIRIEHLADRAWEREWLKDFRPMRFGQRLWVCPAGQRPLEAAPVVLELDPGLAFGTGTHATTALCLEWLDARPLDGLAVLDYGCGSGILALAALKLGAASACAFDIDPQALLATRENALKNGLSGRIAVLSEPDAIAGPFDLVLANILAQPLIELAPRIAAHCQPGGALALAGLLERQAAEVAQAYRPWFDIETSAERDGWSLLSGRRRAEIGVYTQCPDCATVFRVTAEALRAAQGDVRCGVCSTSFNALENLSEQAFKSVPVSADGSPDDSMTVEELPGGENIELSSPVELTAVPDPEPATDEERAMEFHGDSADLDRLFVIEAPDQGRFDPGAVAATLSVSEPKNDLDSTDEHPILVLDEQDEPIEEAGEFIVLESEPHPSTHTGTHTAPRILIPDEMRRRLAEEAAARALAAREFEPQESAGFLSQRWPWVAGIAALALLFALQVVHSKRDDLVRSPGLGPAIAGTYALFGLKLLSPTDLSAYELRQWGAASDPNEANRLLLRASIVNRATYAQPFPLLRLVLQDRFGGTLGTRDIGPADYLPGTGSRGLLQPGERADAVIRIVDPGTEAVGFELDICLPAQGGVRCANQIKTARQ